MTDLERFVRQFVRHLAAAGPARLRQPVAVGDVWREILPYRTHRRALQLDTSEDYELVLMRLCAGEGGFARVEPEEASAAFEREVRSPNPDLGVLRRYESAVLTLAPDAIPSALADAAAPAPASARPAGELLDHLLEIERPAAAPADALRVAPSVSPIPAVPLATSPLSAPAASAGSPVPPAKPAPPVSPILVSPAREPAEPSGGVLCAFCGGALPTDRPVNFCPHCGQGQTQGRCPECGGDIQRGWRYCATCGTAVERGDAPRRRPL